MAFQATPLFPFAVAPPESTPCSAAEIAEGLGYFLRAVASDVLRCIRTKRRDEEGLSASAEKEKKED